MLIKDDVLRQVTARTLRVKEEDLTPEVMLELTHLEAPDYEIKSLEGLEYAENLVVLNVSNNLLEELDPIRDLRRFWMYLEISFVICRLCTVFDS